MKRHIRYHSTYETDIDEILRCSINDCWWLSGLNENWKSYPIKDYIDAMTAVFSCNPDNVESSEGSYCFQLENLKWVFSTLPGTSWTVIPKNPVVRLNSCINPSSPLETIEIIAEIESLCPQFKEYYADLMKKRANRKAGARKSSSGVLSEDAISHYLKYKRKPRHVTAPLAIITNELLNRKFQEYNDAYFDGRLPLCEVGIENYGKRYAAVYVSNAASDARLLTPPMIQISYETTYCYDAYLRSVLLHEMIHHAVAAVLHYRESSHGPVFQLIRKKMNTILRLRIDQHCTEDDLKYIITEPESVEGEARERFHEFWTHIEEKYRNP